ncbi:MAG: class I SAM-dependent methyltransferase [Christensenellales bacterium]|jgi:demethylmenaquinone methyltransferase/2-methoxy-6-polyprenyl-1,4-benzoquinol methylase
MMKTSGEAVVQPHAAKACFDRQGEHSDRHARHELHKLRTIMRVLDLRAGQRVLDVACGTGVLFPWLLSRDPQLLMGIDISKAMTEKARAMHRDSRLRIVTADYFNMEAGNFDRIIVYNAYPCFPDREKFAQKTLRLLIPGGRFVVAHNAGRESVNAVPEVWGGCGTPLQSADEECSWFEPFFEMDVSMDNEELYLISGVKR